MCRRKPLRIRPPIGIPMLLVNLIPMIFTLMARRSAGCPEPSIGQLLCPTHVLVSRQLLKQTCLKRLRIRASPLQCQAFSFYKVEISDSQLQPQYTQCMFAVPSISREHGFPPHLSTKTLGIFSVWTPNLVKPYRSKNERHHWKSSVLKMARIFFQERSKYVDCFCPSLSVTRL